MVKTTTTTKTAATPKKPRAVKKPAAEKAAVHKEPKKAVEKVHEPKPATHKDTENLPKGKYIFATGRRKTAVANVRLFSGKGEAVVNKKPMEKYFNDFYLYVEEVNKPFSLTGLAGQYHFTSHINGGGVHSQAQALQHGISTALGTISPEIRKVLKKNGLLTRDDRKKERKKPGLKRARRSPQWAKR